ncbi:tRNA uridine-5-carboxymethylaminomethyl(34) synthesis enzyme MnmG [Mycoplasma sp. P36-A1]|uniref:tRNA uridine-5-carboxymethylaminomethyl(34) synthesis enzyme MnmG n=1 Tax=Mycoplasma sp. P36-A1 TaxID=3252900 RepID=UPI003C2D5292
MYDIIVIGAGHAGIEACLATSRMNHNTLLITTHIKSIGHLPCNPSIGGPAKGIVVREIDALGGQMGITTDATYIQLKMLNTTKGPAVQSLRAQVDKIKYPAFMKDVVLNQSNLEVLEDSVISLIVDNKKNITGVITKNGKEIHAEKVIITSGTYLESCQLISDEVTSKGPDEYDSVIGLSARLKELGFKLQRLKTGTPARVALDTVDFSKTSVEYGTNEKLAFSDMTKEYVPYDLQVPCYLTYTNLETHKIINDNLSRSSMYSGVVTGIGPRYCPSIEDKLVRFSDKDRHQLFLEPESREMNSIYVQGFSTSMPRDVQEKMIHSIAGLENAKILKYGYAIEYDAIDSTQLYASLESKLVNGLYFAGQINGTSGYEEAAGQGIMAGINAGLSLMQKEPLILKRDEAYIGVMIDDLVTKGTAEPYRLLTSRAEYRLLLRTDNASQRLTIKGYEAGLVSQERYNALLNIDEQTQQLKNLLNTSRFTPKSEINKRFKEIDSSPLYEGVSALELLKRPEITVKFLLENINQSIVFDDKAIKAVEVDVKYEGYIKKAVNQAKKYRELEDKIIPSKINYEMVSNLALEARQKLSNIRPQSIGQASRISGINPSDIQNLLLYIKTGGLND